MIQYSKGKENEGKGTNIDDSLLHIEATDDQNDSLSAPTTPAPTWSAERIVKLIEPWKKSLSQSAEHIPKARGNSYP